MHVGLVVGVGVFVRYNPVGSKGLDGLLMVASLTVIQWWVVEVVVWQRCEGSSCGSREDQRSVIVVWFDNQKNSFIGGGVGDGDGGESKGDGVTPRLKPVNKRRKKLKKRKTRA